MRFVWFFLVVAFSFSQTKKSYTIRTIAFYNVENLFNTQNDSLVFDDERTPYGKYHWTQKRYQKKIENISQVISKIGFGVTGTTPDIIGLCEVENSELIQDLINHSHLVDNEYGIVHSDSPDERGIDVALVYKKTTFLPTSFKSVRLLLFDEEGYRNYTRDQLVVGGLLDDEEIFIIVNHWPSRGGGEMRSKPNRIKAAQLNKRLMDSLRYLNPKVKIISMGDFNDDPVDDSLKKVLKSVGNPKSVDSTSLYNPMEKLFNKGIGTLAYRDRWNVFDQMLLTPNFLSKNKGYFFWKAGIFNPDWLKNKEGRYRGYPYRTYVGTTYLGGYADHFPVYAYLIREAN